jgi:hypothetical protein
MTAYLCPIPREPVIPNPECPRAELHTPCPPGYVEFFEWAAQMSYRRSRQSRCPGCGLYAIWSTPAKPLPAETNP